MLTSLAHAFILASLMLSTELSLPGLSELKLPVTERRCTASHNHSAQPREKAHAQRSKPAQGQVQILSFGP